MRQQAGIPARMVVTDQTGAAADLTGAQYAQVMGAYNAFQHRVKTSIIQVHSERASLPGGGQVEMRHSFGTNTVRVMVPKAMAPAIKGKTIIVDADFLVITYGFIKDNGLDLNTRTRITAPFASNVVGFNMGDYIYAGKSLLATWGGDNHEHGVESVFFDIKEIKKIYQSAQITFECKAIWRNSKGAENCIISTKAYKGGTMGKSGYAFSNDGGALVAEVSKSAENEPGDGELVARVHYNPATNELKLE